MPHTASQTRDRIRVLIADDSTRFCRALTAALSRRDALEIVATAAGAEEALDLLDVHAVDVALIDLAMPGMNGHQLTREVCRRHPGVLPLVLTVSDDGEDLLESLRSGARGYILKTTPPEDIVRGIISVAQGEAWLSPRMAAKLIAEFTSLPAAFSGSQLDEVNLTPREDAVLRQLALGRTNREIAEHLFIAETTVKSHLKSILEKLHVRNRVEAVLCALRTARQAGGGAEQAPAEE